MFFLFLKIHISLFGLSCSMRTFSCGSWALAPRPGTEPGTLVLGAWRLSPWTTREVAAPYAPDLEPKCLTSDTCSNSVVKTGGRGSELLSRSSKFTTNKRPPRIIWLHPGLSAWTPSDQGGPEDLRQGVCTLLRTFSLLPFSLPSHQQRAQNKGTSGPSIW